MIKTRSDLLFNFDLEKNALCFAILAKSVDKLASELKGNNAVCFLWYLLTKVDADYKTSYRHSWNNGSKEPCGSSNIVAQVAKLGAN